MNRLEDTQNSKKKGTKLLEQELENLYKKSEISLKM
jgi:hypothetical protein